MITRAASVLVASVAAAVGLFAAPLGATSGEAGKTALTIKLKETTTREGGGTGTFALVGASAADADSGKLTFTEGLGTYGKAADGLLFRTVPRSETLKGRHGSLVLRATGRVYGVGVAEQDDEVSLGTWSIVSGTGRYARLKGGGGLVGIRRAVVPNSFDHFYSYRYEGLVARS